MLNPHAQRVGKRLQRVDALSAHIKRVDIRAHKYRHGVATVCHVAPTAFLRRGRKRNEGQKKEQKKVSMFHNAIFFG